MLTPWVCWHYWELCYTSILPSTTLVWINVLKCCGPSEVYLETFSALSLCAAGNNREVLIGRYIFSWITSAPNRECFRQSVVRLHLIRTHKLCLGPLLWLSGWRGVSTVVYVLVDALRWPTLIWKNNTLLWQTTIFILWSLKISFSKGFSLFHHRSVM